MGDNVSIRLRSESVFTLAEADRGGETGGGEIAGKQVVCGNYNFQFL